MFNIGFIFVLLLPPALHTMHMLKFVSDINTVHCETDHVPDLGVLIWLNIKALGWKVFSVTLTPKLLGRLGYVIAAGIVTYLARVV